MNDHDYTTWIITDDLGQLGDPVEGVPDGVWRTGLPLLLRDTGLPDLLGPGLTSQSLDVAFNTEPNVLLTLPWAEGGAASAAEEAGDSLLDVWNPKMVLR